MSRLGTATSSSNRSIIVDPLQLASRLWPKVYFYDKQREVIYSVVNNVQTFVPAGNMLGKDFVSAFITLWFFLTRDPVKVVTTSADYAQLESVLWGEIRRFLTTSLYPLTSDRGGPILVNHLHLRKLTSTNTGNSTSKTADMDGLSYCIGRVAAKGEGMLGHHAYPDDWDGVTPHTLFVCDEASGVEDIAYERASTWAKRMLIIGNPYPTANFFKKAVQAGDLLDNHAGL